jgi:heme oxygenase
MTLNLRELTKENHNNIEGSDFAEILLGGRINPLLYYQYLSAQYEIYEALESLVTIPSKLKTVFRASHIMQDMHGLEDEYGLEEITENLESVSSYISHITELSAKGEHDKLLAHLYVRHFGDLHGGQIIKKRVPGSGTMYEFTGRKQLITDLRSMLNNDMAPEAIVCFKFAELLFLELVDNFEGEDFEVDDL